MAKRRRACCAWWLPILLMVPLFFVVAGLSKGSIERGLAQRARAALTRDGVDGITVRGSKWGDLSLSGPAASRDKALAAVAAMGHRHDANKISFADDGTAAAVTTTTAAASTSAAATIAPATTTTAAATTTTAAATTTTAAPATTTTTAKPASVDASAAVAAKTITLTGFVASEAERSAIVNAAIAGFGVANVVDQLQVRAATPTPEIDNAVNRFGTVLTSFGPWVQAAQARLVDTKLSVSGSAFTAAAANDANAVLAAANGAGVAVTGTLTPPATLDQATLGARLRDLLGRTGINFEPDSADITPESEAVLIVAAQSILPTPGAFIRVDGHTDNQGSAASNRALSQARAEAVKANLIAKGVPASQLSTQGFGSTEPIADNSTPEGRAANRRIEFTVL